MGGGNLRMLDHFQMGPNLVRGFAPAGIGPRDLTQFPWTGVYGDALGGTTIGAPAWNFRRRCTSCPRIRDEGRGLCRCRLAMGLCWSDHFPATGEVLSGNLCWTPPCPVDNAMHVRSSVGVGLIWDSPFGPLRFDY